MTGSRFVRRVPRHPRRFLPTAPKPVRLKRHVSVRPARFVVGLDELVGADEDQALPPISVDSAPLRVANYLGRVEELDEAGEITATVWEIPSGREAVTTLSPTDPAVVRESFEPPPEPGDLLRIWTWVELPPNGSEKPRVFFKIDSDEVDQVDQVNEADSDDLQRHDERADEPDGGA